MSVQLKDQIRHHYQAVDTAQEAVDWLEIVERVEMPVVPGPGLPPPSRKVPFLRRPVVIVAIAFAVVILAAVPFLLREPEDPVVATTVPTPTTIVTPTTTPEPATTVPEAVTPEPAIDGVVTWSEVDGAIPPGQAFTFPGGAGLGMLVTNGEDFAIWSSSNGVDWADTGSSLPGSSNSYSIESTPSGFWMTGEEPASLWYSPDAQPGNWEEIDLNQFGRELPPGLRVGKLNVHRPARATETALVPVEYRIDFDWETILGLEPGAYSLFDTAFMDESVADEPAGVMIVTGDTGSGRVTLGRFLPEESADGVRLIDEATGDEVYFLPRGTEGLDGVMLNELGGWSTYSLFSLTPDGVVAVDLWTGEPGSQGSPLPLQVFKFDDSVIATAEVGEGFESHITTDGINFDSHPSPPFEFLSTISQDTYSGYLYTSVWGFWAPTHWISTDSVNWSLLDVDASLPSFLLTLDGAWVVIRSEEGRLSDTHYITFDYETWQPLTGLPTDFSLVQEPIAWDNKILLVGEDTSWLGSLELIR